MQSRLNDNTRLELVRMLVKQKNFLEATRIALQFPNLSNRISSLCEIGKLEAEENPKKAKETFSQALAEVASNVNWTTRDFYQREKIFSLIRISEAQTEVGFVDSALNTLSQATEIASTFRPLSNAKSGSFSKDCDGSGKNR